MLLQPEESELYSLPLAGHSVKHMHLLLVLHILRVSMNHLHPPQCVWLEYQFYIVKLAWP